ncbi:ATP-grasp domain-containing protein [Kitasatospora sp. NPDC088346]|uniref:ATP-grasp domain-containing protein n=1 Tax=Kitasatospora sp. NPDC088346 TaxID=3364073 RepID=UPI00382AE4C1
MEPARDTLLLIGSGSRPFREYILRSVSRHYRLWLLSPRAPSWERGYLAGHSPVDLLDAAAAEAAATSVARRTRVTGVLCYDELSVVTAAHIARALSLPSAAPEAVTACRDKSLGRERLEAAGCPQPRCAAVSSLAEAQDAAADIGYPVVVKPRSLAGSNGVARAGGPGELADHYATAARATFGEHTRHARGGVLVEEYLSGPEISVDSVCRGGEVTPWGLARKHIGFAPWFEETGHTVSAGDELMADPGILRLLTTAHAALGLDHIATHTEIRLTADGPKIVEVNARLGGDLIPYLVHLATGRDLALAAADLAAGRRPDRTADAPVAPVAAIRMLYPPHDMQVTRVEFDTGALPAAVHRVECVVAPGTPLRLPPGGHASRSRYGYAVATADSEEACTGALDAAGNSARVCGTPLAEPQD